MAQITMYPAFINSIETTTTNSISDTDTIIYVLADTAIPNAPNLLVLGTGASAETVLMTDKIENMLTVTRGFQGSAKPWPNGTIIARNYTAYDHRAFKENIEELETNLMNPNLAINGDFQVWQRGVNDFAIPVTNGLYTADRWSVYNQRAGTTVMKSTYGGLTLYTGQEGGELATCLQYKFEVPPSLLGSQITISLVAYPSSAGAITPIMVFNGNNIANLIATSGLHYPYSVDLPIRYTLTVNIPSVVTDNILNILVGHMTSAGKSITFKSFKIEVGSKATPFSPKLYAEELVSCQRYYLSRIVGRAIQVDPDVIYTFCSTPSIMRVSPSFTLAQHITPPGFLQPGFSSSIFTITPSGLIISSVKTAHGLSDLVVNLYGVDAEIY